MSQRDSEANSPSGPAASDEGVVQLHRAALRGVDFRKARFERFDLGGSLFERCDFRGLRIDKRFAPMLVASPRNTFRHCRFDGADLHRTPLGQSRFEHCTFDDALLEGIRAEAAEFVDCRFAGPLDGVTFHGMPPSTETVTPPRKRNEFRGNDFRDAEIGDVLFVGWIDLHAQRWPDDEIYVNVDNFRRRLAKARTEVREWYERDRRPALAMLDQLAKRWRDQDHVFTRRWSARIDAPDRVQARVWELLEHA